MIAPDFLGEKTADEPHVIRLYCPWRFMYRNNHIAIAWRAEKQIHEILRTIEPDVVHVHHPFILGSAGLKAARKLGLPVVFTYHTLYEHYVHYIPLIPRRLTAWIAKKIVLRFCTRVDQIIAPSSYVHTYLKKNSIQTPIEIIPSPILPLFLYARPADKTIDTPCRLLTVGRFVPEKNIPFLLSMFARLDHKKYTFELIGFGALLDELKDFAFNRLQLPPSVVTFTHRPAKELIAQKYYESDIFIFASYTETQGLVTVESMACGTPVIALQGPGQEDIIVHGSNGYLVHSMNDMINKIELVSADRPLYKHLSTHAWHTGQAYSPDSLTQKLVILYQQVIPATTSQFH